MLFAGSRGVVGLLLAVVGLAGGASLLPSTAAAGPGAAGLVHPTTGAPWPRYTLRADGIWQLNLPGGQRFDASGLFLTPEGELLTESDRGAGVYRILFHPGVRAADLLRLPDCFSDAQLAPFAAEKVGRYDCEGVTRDAQGRLYLCEEANRWILRWDPVTKQVERLAIDWKPVEKYFDPIDRNASFEGITVAGAKLYVANERKVGRIIAVDLATLKVVDDFAARPYGCTARDVHYSDLCWFDGALYALLRESWVVLKINPATHRVLAEYNYRDMEQDPDVVYRNQYPTGVMEGLAVSRDQFWLVTDNNGRARARHRHDRRPTLFHCPRPDR